MARPWWKRKRWIVAAVLWLVVAYPLSVGPLWYVILESSHRGWAWRAADIYARPYAAFRDWSMNPAGDIMDRYDRYCKPEWVPEPPPRRMPVYEWDAPVDPLPP